MVTLHDAFASKLRAKKKRLQAMCPKTPMYYITVTMNPSKKNPFFVHSRFLQAQHSENVFHS